MMFSDTRKKNVLLSDASNQIMFFRHVEENCFASSREQFDVFNNITYSDTKKTNVLLPDESNKIMFSDT